MTASASQSQNAKSIGLVDTTMTMVDPKPPVEVRSSFDVAYDRRLSEITAVPDEELVRLNLDVGTTVMTVLGALPQIDALRSAMRGLADLNLHYVDGLEDYARAAGEAHARYMIATTPPEDITALNAEAVALRETLKLDATVLAHRGLIEEERLAAFRGLAGFKNVGFELIGWAILLRDCWPRIRGKTALTAEEIGKAKLLGERLVQLAGVREQAPVVVAEVARIRRQAMTLLMNAYDEVQRAVGYLRWHQDDANTIAPSLYADGRGKRPQPSAAPEPTPASDAASVPGAPSIASAPETPVPPGFPGASPYEVN